MAECKCRAMKKRFSIKTEKYRSYRKTQLIPTLPNPIALRKNDSRTNLICQTKTCAPVHARFRQVSLFTFRRLSGTLTETNTDDALHLYHDSISFFNIMIISQLQNNVNIFEKFLWLFLKKISCPDRLRLYTVYNRLHFLK